MRLAAFVVLASCAAPAASLPPTIVPVILPSPQPLDVAPEPPKKRTGPCPDGMIAIPGGAFAMKNRGDVKIDAFCMDRTEVTAAAFTRCVEAGKCSDQDLQCDKVYTFRVPGKEDHPMNCV